MLWRCGVTFYQGYQGKELQDRSSISDPQNDQFLSRKPLSRSGSTCDWISKEKIEHKGYGIRIAGKVLPVPFTSILIGFIEWSLPRLLDSTDLIGFQKHWLIKVWRWGLQGNQIADSLLFTVFNVKTCWMIDCKRRVDTWNRRSYVFFKVKKVFLPSCARKDTSPSRQDPTMILSVPYVLWRRTSSPVRDRSTIVEGPGWSL